MTFDISKGSCRALKVAQQVLQEHGVEHRLIGALAPQAILRESYRTTLDADIAILVRSWDHYEEIRTALLDRGFVADRSVRHRLRLGDTHIDLLPYSPALLDGEDLVWPEGGTINMRAFEHVFRSEGMVEIGEGLSWPVVSIPVFVVLKLVCFRDRGAWKDLADVLFCLDHYDEDPELSKRYVVGGEDSELTWQNAGAYLLGKEVQRCFGPDVQDLVESLGDTFDGADAPAVDSALGELSICPDDPGERTRIIDLVKAFARGFER